MIKRRGLPQPQAIRSLRRRNSRAAVSGVRRFGACAEVPKEIK